MTSAPTGPAASASGFSRQDAAALREALPPLDFSAARAGLGGVTSAAELEGVASADAGARKESAANRAALPELAARYRRFYGLDRNGLDQAAAAHHLGYFDSGEFRLACHHFLPQRSQSSQSSQSSQHSAAPRPGEQGQGRAAGPSPAEPHAAPCGTVFLVHGYYDHAGLYGHLIRYCLSRHFAVVIFDLPGHGLSTGEPASIDDFARYRSALERCLALAGQAQLTEPWSLIGQSTGGAIVMDYLLQGGSRPDFDSIALLAPLVRPHNWQRGRLRYYLSRFFIKRVERDFARNSSDEAFLRFVREQDPLQYPWLPTRWVGALDAWLRRFNGCASSQQPLSVIQGTADKTVDWPHNLQAIQKKFPHARIHRLEGARHHLINESPAIRRQLWQRLDQSVG